MPRRFAPRNDSGGRPLQPLTPGKFLHTLRAKRPCNRAHASSFSMSLRTSAHTGVAIRFPSRETWQAGNTYGKFVVAAYSPGIVAFRFALPQGGGLPRRFAPRNDMQKLAACPHNTWALPVYCRKASLQPLTRHRLQHVIASHVLATADTHPSFACHCEPVRTLAWQSASQQKHITKLAVLWANP